MTNIQSSLKSDRIPAEFGPRTYRGPPPGDHLIAADVISYDRPPPGRHVGMGNPERRKHRSGRRHWKLKQQRGVARSSGRSAIPAPLHADKHGERGTFALRTALFENPKELDADINLVKRAIRCGWETNKILAVGILEKIASQALGLPYTNSEGMTTQSAPYRPDQLIKACNLLLTAERQNQADEHHADWLALELEAKSMCRDDHPCP